jgi:hypothetical protein
MVFRSSLTAIGIAVLCNLPIGAIAQTPPARPVTTPAVSAPKAVLQDAEKEQDIRQLISLTGGDKVGQQMLDQMIPQMQKMLPQVPEAFWQEFRKKTKMSELTERLLPIYDKYYSKEDVKGLIQFYQTPLGQRVIATMPDISRESQAVGSAWGQEIAGEIISELKKKEAAQPAPAKPQPQKSPAAKSGKATSHGN